MKSLLYKELKLSSLAVTYFFIAFGLMTFLPGYPILLGSFFVCMGIFYSFQFSRESNDPLFTVLLPVAKTDAVRAKFLFVLVVQGLSFLLMTICTLVFCCPAPPFTSKIRFQTPTFSILAFVLSCSGFSI